MRIIAGKCKGMRIQAPRGRITRPIPDRIKQALFSSLGSEYGTPGALPELAVLDLFAGSGAFGLEALSRGARLCCFVERYRPALNCLRENIRKLNLSGQCWIVTGDAFSCDIPDEPTGAGWELVFLDPPYAAVEINIDSVSVPNLLMVLADMGKLADDATIILRHPSNIDFDRRIGKLYPYQTKTYSTMSFTWFNYDKQIS